MRDADFVKLTLDVHALADRLEKVEEILRRFEDVESFVTKMHDGLCDMDNQLGARLAKVEAACKACYASAHALASAEGRPVCKEWCGTDDGSMFPRVDGSPHFRGPEWRYYCSEACRTYAATLNPAPPREAAKDSTAPPCVNGASQCRGMGCRDYPCSCKHMPTPQPSGNPRELKEALAESFLDHMRPLMVTEAGREAMGTLPAEPSSDAGQILGRGRPLEPVGHEEAAQRIAEAVTPAPSEPAKRPPPISDDERARRAPTVHPAVMMNASEPAKAPSERMLDVAAERIADLEARLAEAEKDRAFMEAHAKEGWDLASKRTVQWKEAEKARDRANEMMKHERATCLADERAKEAVIAERARVNGWWMVWLTQQGNRVMTVGERDDGIASGASAPKGSAT